MRSLVCPSGASVEWYLNRPFPEFSVDDEEQPMYQSRSAGFWLRQLDDHDPMYRVEAVQALEKIGSRMEGVVAALGGMLKDSDPLGASVPRGHSVGSAPKLWPALPALLAALEDGNQFVRANAAAAVGPIGQEDPEVLTALAKAVKDPGSAVRRLALGSLQAIGPKAAGVLDSVRQALTDVDAEVRKAAADALVRIEGPKDSPDQETNQQGRHGLNLAPCRWEVCLPHWLAAAVKSGSIASGM